MELGAVDWDTRYAAQDVVWGTEPNRFVVQEFTGVHPGRALDLGTGEGRHAIWLAELGWHVTAVDFSSVAIERARRLADKRHIAVEWEVADLREYRPEVGAFDAVLVAYVHLPQPQRHAMLSRAVDALAPGGRIVVIGHDVTNLTGGTGGPQDPAILYTPDSIRAELGTLAIRKAERKCRLVRTDHGVVPAIDTVVDAVLRARP